MRVVALPLLLAALLAMPCAARADFLLGLASTHGMTGLNVEKTGDAGSVYALLGAYPAETGFEFADLTGIIGFRRFQGGKFASGYFAGGFIGDVDGGPDFTRYGAGGEIGYQWLTEHLRMEAHAGMSLAGESSRGAREGDTDISPVPMLGASISLRF